MAAIGFVGKIFTKTSFNEGAVVDSKAVGSARSMPTPGCNNNAKVKAIAVSYTHLTLPTICSV